MKISVLTGNQPRHLSLVHALSEVSDSIFAVTEEAGPKPSEKPDAPPIMKEYFGEVDASEQKVFGRIETLPSKVQHLALGKGELNTVSHDSLAPVFESQLVLVYGTSFIRAPLVQKLIEREAINLHIGLSPYYRGSACNFWALHDGRADLVGATIHRLTAGLDSGPMLFHALPAVQAYDPFLLGMISVKAAHAGLIEKIRDGSLLKIEPQAQNKKLELRYSRGAEFTAEVAQDFLDHRPSAQDIEKQLRARDDAWFLHPTLFSFE